VKVFLTSDPSRLVLALTLAAAAYSLVGAPSWSGWRHACAEFSWEGSDDNSPASGRG